MWRSRCQRSRRMRPTHASLVVCLRCRALIPSTKLLSSALSPGGACTVPVPRPWRPLLHVSVGLPLPLGPAPPRWNGEGQHSSDHLRSSPVAARIQRRWRNLALRRPPNFRLARLSVQHIMRHFFASDKSGGRLLKHAPYDRLLLADPSRSAKVGWDK